MDLSQEQKDLQAALDVGGVVTLPAGRFELSVVPFKYYCLNVPPGTTVQGHPDGTILALAPNTPSATRILHVTGAGTRLENLVLDGNKANHQPDEHRAGVFAHDATDLVLQNVEARNFTGDGVYFGNNLVGLRVTDCVCQDNDRNGLTLSGNISDVVIRGGDYSGNVAQQIDSEPVGALLRDVTLVGVNVDARGGGDYALTVSGTQAIAGERWLVTRCTIKGSVFCVWANEVVVHDCDITSYVTKRPALRAYRSGRVSFVGNRVTGISAGIDVMGTGTGQAPTGLVANNTVTLLASGLAIRSDGGADVSVLGNNIAGVGGSAVYLRATNPNEPFYRGVVLGNTCFGFQKNLDVRGYSLDTPAYFGSLASDITPSTDAAAHVNTSILVAK